MIHPENLFNFIVKVQNLLFREFSNVIVSPFSLEALFLGILSGAEGACNKELANCLFGQDVDSNDISEMMNAFKAIINQIGAIQNADFKMNNFIYISDKFQVRPTYCSYVSKYLNILIKQLNFEDESLEAYARIDADVRTASLGRINKILKCLPTVSCLMLVSQVSFQSELKYKPLKQYDGHFKATNQDDASTQFTVLRNSFKLNEKNPDFVYIELPYVNEGMNLCIVLPAEGKSLRELASSLKYDKAMQLSASSVFSQVEVHLPILKVQSNVDLAMVLQLCGISKVFESENSDFSKMVNDSKGLFLESVVTNSELILQDTPKVGTQTEDLAPSEPLSTVIIINRPFMYSVTYSAKSLQTITLFTGVVNIIE